MTTTFAYRLMDLGGLDHRALEAEFNQLGRGGWELMVVLAPQTGIFKRAEHQSAKGPEKESVQHVAAKYRDPETGETWSGRGRMATWLAVRVKAGARLEDFLV